MNIKIGYVNVAATVCALALIQTQVSANPLRGILDTVNEVNSTINSVDSTINGTNHSVNSLRETLGLESSSPVDSNDSTGQVLLLYKEWYSELPADEKETVSWLVMENARSQSVTFDTVSNSDWFLQKTSAEQSKVAANYFQLQQLIDASAQDRNRFLGFAFCVNSGSQSCEV